MCWFKELMEYAAEYKSKPEIMKHITKKIEHFIEKAEKVLPDEVEELHCDLEMVIHGPHFTEYTAEKAVAEMKNDDNTVGAHWSLDETTAVAEAKGIDFETKRYNMYDWFYTMNMFYSDFFMLNRGDLTKVAEESVLWLDDKDAPEGKSYLYYKAMKKGKLMESGRS